jgi:RimJ/RimL family protein N-acetyltransferase
MPSVRLRPVAIEDAEQIHVWRSEPSASVYQPILPIGLDTVRDLIANRMKGMIGPTANGDFQWIVLADDRPAGWISLKIDPVDRAHGNGSIGYTIGEAFRRRGVGKGAVAALLPVAFGRDGFNLERVDAIAAIDNIASRRVLEGNGFRFEGVQRGLLIIRGIRVDHAMYGLLRTDWED